MKYSSFLIQLVKLTYYNYHLYIKKITLKQMRVIGISNIKRKTSPLHTNDTSVAKITVMIPIHLDNSSPTWLFDINNIRILYSVIVKYISIWLKIHQYILNHVKLILLLVSNRRFLLVFFLHFQKVLKY